MAENEDAALTKLALTNAPVPDVASRSAISRDAMERVLARATELQGSSGDATETISEARLLDVAREVGIDAQHLRQAMAEERARIAFDEPDGGMMLNALGISLVDAQRVVPGGASDVQARLESWLPRMEGLVVRRRMAQRTSWEPRRDPVGNVLRALNAGGRRLDLSRADQVVATVTPVDASRSVVRFDVELSGARRTQRTALFATIGVNAVVFVAMAVPAMFIMSGSPNAPGLMAGLATIGAMQAGLTYGVWRSLRTSYRRTLSRVQLRLEQLLDDLEQGNVQSPPSVIGQVANALLGARGSR